MFKYITTATTTQVVTGSVRKAVVQVNKALTGTIGIVDNTTGTTVNVGLITNPAVGDIYEYWDLGTGLRIVTSAICDITVSADQSNGPK